MTIEDGNQVVVVCKGCIFIMGDDVIMYQYDIYFHYLTRSQYPYGATEHCVHPHYFIY